MLDQAVEAGGVVRAVRITEIGGPGREDIHLQGLSSGVCQICARLHHHRLTARPIEIEPEWVRRDARPGVASGACPKGVTKNQILSRFHVGIEDN